MEWKDKYRFVKQNMKRNKSRLFMTILATAMGCCFLVVLASIGFGFQKSITEEITSFGKITEVSIYGKTNTSGEMTKVDSVFLFVKLGLLFVGAIAVLIAAIGIYNTMTMAVTERTQDIGIMKAIGASPSSIRSIFLIESSFIGIVGTLIGTIVAFGVSLAANRLIPIILSKQNESNEPMNFVFSDIPYSLIGVSAAISIGIAILSGMRPARRATEVDVLKALRRDL
ncbi:ABC transporter permease [Paenibacillus luteus]|uniref:ABC transporter permease n=1 Tax=Paenibacillus luteus TaxID=2545753 RepID=UPI00114345CC|nr:FtsX-like permease family protein [Paenibacillus luteus]